MRDHNIFVTIAIPFYNSECFLADAIQSVVNQTYINWELLLMDDNVMNPVTSNGTTVMMAP